jgi:hypothetical protein
MPGAAGCPAGRRDSRLTACEGRHQSTHSGRFGVDPANSMRHRCRSPAWPTTSDAPSRPARPVPAPSSPCRRRGDPAAVCRLIERPPGDVAVALRTATAPRSCSVWRRGAVAVVWCQHRRHSGAVIGRAEQQNWTSAAAVAFRQQQGHIAAALVPAKQHPAKQHRWAIDARPARQAIPRAVPDDGGSTMNQFPKGVRGARSPGQHETSAGRPAAGEHADRGGGGNRTRVLPYLTRASPGAACCAFLSPGGHAGKPPTGSVAVRCPD